MRSPTIAAVCAVSFLTNGVLQLLLALGLPLGRFVLGGAYTVSPPLLRPVNLAFFLAWSACALAYLRYGGLLRRPLQERTARAIVYASTLWLLIASVFNLFITTSAFERYVTGTLSTLTGALSLYLVWRHDGLRLCPCRIDARR
ncbi:hypothetical protein E4J66_11355 [Actinomyces viscosus]|uniref:Uncharacterized protein n=1 Tax=Actinomyces viscosus TaxID=1656 RepID=A0A3S4V267_ACTVI|nr:hypothetical protein [Actinomyces viscosus]TFH51611.1 hypothetical protein E4J66_11355 [Actinomyces viscosus]VEI15705.1 Uncharacterised protein [Actinomyces viscosus]